jgi:AcrR family transcriptional regulator
MRSGNVPVLQRARYSPADPALLDATAEVLADGGIRRLSLERIAAAASTSRVTLWRQGVTTDGLIAALLDRMTDDYVRTLWPVLTMAEPAAARLEAALQALCAVADRHAAILCADDELFHLAGAKSPGVFVEPLDRLLRDGVADGTLLVGDRDLHELATTIFNVVVWPFVHLRARHGWSAERAAANVVELALGGVQRS